MIKSHLLEILDKPTCSVREAAELLGISESAAYAAAQPGGDLPAIRIGQRIIVPTSPLRRMLGIED